MTQSVEIGRNGLIQELLIVIGSVTVHSVWRRYIDDMFTIWPHGEECFKNFLQQINSMHPTIKFTAEWSYRSVSFLDVKTTLNEDGQITTNQYTKPTNT